MQLESNWFAFQIFSVCYQMSVGLRSAIKSCIKVFFPPLVKSYLNNLPGPLIHPASFKTIASRQGH